MKTRVMITALVIGLLVEACASEPLPKTVEWQGHALREVKSVAELPPILRSTLGVDRSGLEGVADRGRRFNVTDVVDARLPMRRFVAAGNDGDTWIVAIERGGRAYSVEVFLFAGDAPTPKETWVLFDHANSLTEVLRDISRRGKHER